ncbi:MAG TPA: HEAT repeat domain-containing protein, partial [Planctomycetota bacterium]|nr:HEAT repeat domain-containing protein [Planctomycetota bacterium]
IFGRGRIWRVRKTGGPRIAAPALDAAPWMELARALESDNGWVRDRVQQAFVEEGTGEAKARVVLEELLATTQHPLARMHAVWALSGMRALKPEVVKTLLADPDERVREAAVRCSEALVGGDRELLAAWLRLARGDTPAVRTQVVLSLGEVHTEAAERALFELVLDDVRESEDRAKVLSSLARRELPFLELALATSAFESPKPGRAAFVQLLAACIAREGNDASTARVLELVVEGRRIRWQRDALAAGLLEGRTPASEGHAPALRLVEEPRAFATLQRLTLQLALAPEDPLVELAHSLSWPGHPLAGETAVRPLDASETALFERGRALFANVCSGCHQTSGLGLQSMAPPLRGSEWVMGERTTLGRILLGGLTGPISVRGEHWELEMPAVVATDEEIAGVLTYVRREWGHTAEPVQPAAIKALREESRKRGRAWTAAELKALER